MQVRIAPRSAMWKLAVR